MRTGVDFGAAKRNDPRPTRELIRRNWSLSLNRLTANRIVSPHTTRSAATTGLAVLGGRWRIDGPRTNRSGKINIASV
jgi:hypothetical protein